jgi:hypothetical protein
MFFKNIVIFLLTTHILHIFSMQNFNIVFLHFFLSIMYNILILLYNSLFNFYYFYYCNFNYE